MTRSRSVAFIRLVVAFASVSLLLAGVGIQGVSPSAVERRRNEFAIRLALGATPAAYGASWYARD